MDIINTKTLRLWSVIEAMESDPEYEPNFESLEDSFKDLINYGRGALRPRGRGLGSRRLLRWDLHIEGPLLIRVERELPEAQHRVPQGEPPQVGGDGLEHVVEACGVLPGREASAGVAPIGTDLRGLLGPIRAGDHDVPPEEVFFVL